MKINVILNEEESEITPIRFADATITFWLSDTITEEERERRKSQLRETAQHINIFLDALNYNESLIKERVIRWEH